MPQESKLTSFFSKKSKAQSPSVLTEVLDSNQVRKNVAAETSVCDGYTNKSGFTESIRRQD